MAAIDPTAKPLNKDGPGRSTLKILRRSQMDIFEDEAEESSGEESESDDSNEESESENAGKKGTPKKASKAAAAKALKEAADNEMEVDGIKDEDEDDKTKGSGLEPYVLCTLDPAKVWPGYSTHRNQADFKQHYQQPLELTLNEEEPIYFRVTGDYSVFLTGNYLTEENDFEGDSEDSDYDQEPSEDEMMYGQGIDTDSESDELDDLEDPRIKEIDTGDEDEDEEEEEQKPKKLTKAEKKADKKALKRSAPESNDGEDVIARLIRLSDKLSGAKDVKDGGEQKLSKKQLKKLKANNGKAVDASVDTPEGKKKVQFAKVLEQGPTPSPAKDKKAEPKKESKSTTRIVDGIIIEDKKLGTGPQAKKGNRLGMRYMGKVQGSDKLFDKNVKGKPFQFNLGKSEVIKGWDIGLVGMQVGGERRITIPAVYAYGKKELPGIPKNSTLVFDGKYPPSLFPTCWGCWLTDWTVKLIEIK